MYRDENQRPPGMVGERRGQNRFVWEKEGTPFRERKISEGSFGQLPTQARGGGQVGTAGCGRPTRLVITTPTRAAPILSSYFPPLIDLSNLGGKEAAVLGV